MVFCIMSRCALTFRPPVLPGDILSPCLYLFTGSQLDLELHFYDAAVDGNGEYFLDLSQCFPFAEADALQAWLESLPAQA